MLLFFILLHWVSPSFNALLGGGEVGEEANALARLTKGTSSGFCEMKSATTKFLRKLGAGANYAKAGDSSFVYGASPIDIVCHNTCSSKPLLLCRQISFVCVSLRQLQWLWSPFMLCYTLIMYWIATSYGHRFTSAFTATIYTIFWLSTFR